MRTLAFTNGALHIASCRDPHTWTDATSGYVVHDSIVAARPGDIVRISDMETADEIISVHRFLAPHGLHVLQMNGLPAVLVIRPEWARQVIVMMTVSDTLALFTTMPTNIRPIVLAYSANAVGLLGPRNAIRKQFIAHLAPGADVDEMLALSAISVDEPFSFFDKIGGTK